MFVQKLGETERVKVILIVSRYIGSNEMQFCDIIEYVKILAELGFSG